MDGAAALFLFYILFFGAIVWGVIHNKAKYNAIPTLKEYLETFPHAKTRHGIRCGYCNSKNLRNWGVNGANDRNRTVHCNSCGEKLYRVAHKD